MSLAALSGNQDIDGILWGVKWDGGTITYGFATATSQYTGYPIGGIHGFQAFNATQQAAVNQIIAQVNGLIQLQINFTSDPSQANLRYAEATAVNDGSGLTSVGTAYGIPPDGTIFPDYTWGDMFFNPTNYNSPHIGNYAYITMIHEMGHALGLKHGHEANQTYPGTNTLLPALPANHDGMEYSVMTYRSYVGGPTNGYTNETNGFAQSLMMDDIAALQYLYGADYSTNSGDTTYSWSTTTGQMSIDGVGQATPGSNRVFLTIWDGGGKDTYDMTNYTTSLTIDLQPGDYSITSSTQRAILDTGLAIKAHGNVYNAWLYNNDQASLIENANGGSAADSITGNIGKNFLTGNGGNDTLNGLGGKDKLSGGTGADTMGGGAGNDIYYVDNAGDSANEGADAGKDTVRSSIGITLGTNLENLILTGNQAIDGAGNGANNQLTGNSAINHLDGKGGNDKLTGGGAPDVLTGGTGNDHFIFNALSQVGDTVTDFSSAVTGDSDVFEFDGAAFGGLAAGHIHATQFQSGTGHSALTADVRLFYETDTHKLFFDDDGSGADAGILVATLQAGATVVAHDILII